MRSRLAVVVVVEAVAEVVVVVLTEALRSAHSTVPKRGLKSQSMSVDSSMAR